MNTLPVEELRHRIMFWLETRVFFIVCLICGFLPDDAILCSTPKGVGPHGCCGYALDPVGVIREHMDGFLHCQVMHVDLCVGCTCYQNSVPRVWQELYEQTKNTTVTWQVQTQRLLFKSYITLWTKSSQWPQIKARCAHRHLCCQSSDLPISVL